jgi:hypothetical protein
MHTQTANRLGFWSALLVFMFSITFTIGALANLPKPWDVYIPIGSSLLLALTYVVMMASIHYVVEDEKKIWSHIGLSFAVLYATMVSIVYVTWLFVVEPLTLRGEADKVSLLIFAPGSFSQMVDGFGYTLQMVAAFFTGAAFTNQGLGRSIHWTAIANGIFAIPVFISYATNNIILGLGWVIFLPVFSLLLVFYFRRESNTFKQTYVSAK